MNPVFFFCGRHLSFNKTPQTQELLIESRLNALRLAAMATKSLVGVIYTIGAELIYLDALRSLIKWKEIVNTAE